MAHPYPDLQVHPLSGLDFPWAFYHPDITGNFDAHLGPDGITTSEVMLIRWEDLETALTQLLGYSYREDRSDFIPPSAGRIRRVLPWQHPYFNQLWCKAITSCRGLVLQGTNEQNPNDFFVSIGRGNFVGLGQPYNYGPWTEFKLAMLTVQFWRPPYFVRSDDDILDASGNPQEWLRYVDKNWEVDAKIMTRQAREGCQYLWGGGQGIPAAPGPPGAVGTVVSHSKLVKRWYQVPEASLFTPLVDAALNGEPFNQLYMQTATTNPITGYIITPSSAPANVAYHAHPMLGTVNSPSNGGVADTAVSGRFFGCPMGTLRLDSVEFIPRPLQLPPYLMQIANFNGNEPVSQLQYDVVFHFDRFDPPRSMLVATSAAVIASSGALLRQAYRGHNLVPWAGDGMFNAILSQENVVGGGGFRATPFNYSVFHDLFVSQ